MATIDDGVGTAPISPLDRSSSENAALVAVVHTVDSIRFIATSTCRQELVQQMARYTCENAPDRLWPDDAARVTGLVAGGAAEAAIAHYFGTVGQRWDTEWLVTTNFTVQANI